LDGQKNLYTITEAADALGYSRSWIKREIVNGNLDAEKVGSVWIVFGSAVDEYVRRPRGARPKQPAKGDE